LEFRYPPSPSIDIAFGIHHDIEGRYKMAQLQIIIPFIFSILAAAQSMDTSQITILVALITGVSGFLASMVNLLLGIRKQRVEDRRLALEEKTVPETLAGSMVASAKDLTELQEKIYGKSLREYSEQIDTLRISFEELQRTSNERKQMLDDQSADLFLLKKKVSEQDTTIARQQAEIDMLVERDKTKSAAISRLLKGIGILVVQMKNEKLIPSWTPNNSDISII
jgi:hypothetical protein